MCHGLKSFTHKDLPTFLLAWAIKRRERYSRTKAEGEPDFSRNAIVLQQNNQIEKRELLDA
jgi:hypothetical protein